LRTQLSLELLGSLGRYAKVFQLERYARVRTLFIASVLQSRDVLLHEVREQLAPQNVPRAARVLSLIAPPPLLRMLLDAYATACSRKDASLFDLPSSHRVRAPHNNGSDLGAARAAMS
jgi:hypothetical protein